MRNFILAAAALAVTGVAVAHAAGHAGTPFAHREAVMKNVGAATGALGAMAKGEAPFDAGLAQMSFRVLSASAHGFGGLMEEGSLGRPSRSAPKIAEDSAGWSAAMAKFQADADAAVAAEVADLDAMRASFGAVAANCKACHEAYRLPKEE